MIDWWCRAMTWSVHQFDLERSKAGKAIIASRIKSNHMTIKKYYIILFSWRREKVMDSHAVAEMKKYAQLKHRA
jgi:hypothetical protein